MGKASHRAKSKYPTHVVIPDVQCKPGVNSDHLRHVGNFIAEKRPEKIIQIGDFNDMASLSSYAVGRAEAEGTRYVDDIENGKRCLELLDAPIRKAKHYTPDKRITLGNHCARIDIEASKNPRFMGKISTDDLGYKEAGWRVHQYLEVAKIDGVEYSHFFVAGVMGRPVSSAAALLRARHCSAVMGHVQKIDIAIHPNTQQTALFSGICYTHKEDYLTPQGQDTRRGIWALHEVHNGVFDIMFVSLDFLRRRYS